MSWLNGQTYKTKNKMGDAGWKTRAIQMHILVVFFGNRERAAPAREPLALLGSGPWCRGEGTLGRAGPRVAAPDPLPLLFVFVSGG